MMAPGTHVADECANCQILFKSPDLKMKDLTLAGLPVIDALFYIYGLTKMDIDNESLEYYDDMIENGKDCSFAFCSKCVSIITEVYLAHRNLCKASNENSILQKALRNKKEAFGLQMKVESNNDDNLDDDENSKDKTEDAFVYESSERYCDDGLKKDIDEIAALETFKLETETFSVGSPSDNFNENYSDDLEQNDSELAEENESVVLSPQPNISLLEEENALTKIPMPFKTGKRDSTAVATKCDGDKSPTRKRKKYTKHSTWECRTCNIEFTHRPDFVSHVSTHKTLSLKCELCDKILYSVRSKRLHLTLSHPENNSNCNSTDKNCDICGETFSSVYDYEIHSMSHRNEIPYECQVCHKKFSNYKSYGLHQKEFPCDSGLTKEIFNCSNCPNSYKAKYLLMIHTLIEHKKLKKNAERRYNCELCGKVIKKFSDFEQHFISHTKEAVCSCDICGKPLCSVLALDAHRKTHKGEGEHNKTFKCKECEFICSQYYILTTHIKNHHSSDDRSSFECKVCGKSFLNSDRLKRHVSRHGKQEQCSVCGKILSNSQTLNDHMRSHTGNLLKCHLCEKKFTGEKSLKYHLDAKHFDKGHVCPICGVVFTLKHLYTNHMKVHSGEKPYKCKICGEDFEKAAKLGEHRKLYHTETKLQCQDCKKDFKTLNTLRYHIRSVHKGFTCSICEQHFQTIWLYQSHQRKEHNLLKRYHCPHCGKVFMESQNLKKHLKVHISDKNESIPCNICGVPFANKRHLTMHTNKEHKN